ncbi:MAG: ABC transporter substrate-binding protein [Candidatus Rokuibacteriota bacterium]
MIARREFANGLAAAGIGGLVGVRARPAAAEPPLETTRIRLVQTPSMCQAPQYVAEELLRGEGFTEVVYLKRPGPQDIASVIASGEVDLNLHFSARLVVRLDRGDPITILAGVHPGCFELFTAQPLRTLVELKGKTIAIRAIEGPEHVFLSSMLAYVGLDPRKDVTWVTRPAAASIELLGQGKVDAFMGFPPDPQGLRARKIGHVLVNSTVDRPWSQYFCCMVAANREFVQKHPVATKRALRAIMKGTDVCAGEPDRASRLLVDSGRTKQYDLMRQVLKDIPYNRWRDYNPEDTIRFYALRLHEAGMIKASPQKLIAQGTDWRFLNELKRELKG